MPINSEIPYDIGLRSQLVQLEACSAHCRTLFHFFTAVVILGIAVEIIVLAREYRDDLHDFKRGIVLPPQKPRRLLFALALLGILCVGGGVAGELWAELNIETMEAKIRVDNDQMYAILSKAAGDAKKSARMAEQELRDQRKGMPTLPHR